MKNRIYTKIIVFMFVLLILIFIFYINKYQNNNFKSIIDIKNPKKIGDPFVVFSEDKEILSFKPWETYLDYQKIERIIGTNEYKKIININKIGYNLLELEDKLILSKNEIEIKKGFFFREVGNQEIIIKSENNKSEIKIKYSGSVENDPKEIFYIITTLKDKNILKVNLGAQIQNYNLLRMGGIGLNIKNYDILTSEGKTYKNDREVQKTDLFKDIYIEDKLTNIYDPLLAELQKGKILIKGTNFNIKPKQSYQIFENKDTKNAIIVFSEEIDNVENIFKYEVFRFWITKKENSNTFAPLYIAILNQATLEYKNNTYIINSKEFNGNIKTLIQDWTF